MDKVSCYKDGIVEIRANHRRILPHLEVLRMLTYAERMLTYAERMLTYAERMLTYDVC